MLDVRDEGVRGCSFGNWDARFAVSLQGQGKIPVDKLPSVIEGRVLQVEDPQV